MDSPLIDPVWLKALAKTLLLPPTGLLLIALLGLALRRRFARMGGGMAWAGVVGLLLLSVPAVAGFMVRFLDASPPFERSQASNAQAIVILGGGTRRKAPEYGGDTLGALTLERVRYGARVARLTGLPILVTGGSLSGGEPEAKLMRASLENEFATPVRWIEDRSRNTHENALRTAAILRAEGFERVVLVAHSFDMLRARAEFAAAGLATVPAATGIPGSDQDSFFDYLPSIAGLRGSYFALYEILANLVRWLAPTG